MSPGEWFVLLLRLVCSWLQHRYAPEQVRFRELAQVRRASEVERVGIEKAISTGDTAAIARILRGLRADEDGRTSGD